VYQYVLELLNLSSTTIYWWE